MGLLRGGKGFGVVVMIITPITSDPSLAFLPRYKWTKQETRRARICRIQLARELRPKMAERYEREQMDSANSGTDAINRRSA